MSNNTIPLLEKLISQLELALSEDNNEHDYTVRFPVISGTFDAITLSKNESIPGISIIDYKRKIKNFKNTYHSVYTGIVDNEIKVGRARKELGTVIANLEAIHGEFKAASEQAMAIVDQLLDSQKTLVEQPKLVENKIPKEKVKTTASTIGDAIADKAKKDLIKMSDEAKKRVQQVIEEDETLIKDASLAKEAPKTAEGWRKLQQETPPTPEEKKAEEVRQQQDEVQFTAFSRFQPALQKLARLKPSGDSDWVLSKGPILFNAKPFISDLALQQAKLQHTQIYPGWIIENQWVLGIRPSLLSKKKELLELLHDVRDTIASRMESYPIFMLTPPGSEKTFIPPEKITQNLSDPKRDLKSVKELGKAKQDLKKAAEKDKITFELPRFAPLKGSNLVWTWILSKAVYSKLPNFTVLNFGFPVASELRNFQERIAEKVVPKIHEQHQQLVQDVTHLGEQRKTLQQKYSEELEKVHEGEEESINVQIAKIEQNLLDKGKELDIYKKNQQALDKELKMHFNAAVSGTDKTAVDIAKKFISDIEVKLATLKGEVSGIEEVLKNQRSKLNTLKERKEVIRQQIIKELKGA